MTEPSEVSDPPEKRRWWRRPGPVGGKPLPLDEEQWVDRIVARGIYRIALISVISIAIISGQNSLLQAEVVGAFVSLFRPDSDTFSDAEVVQFTDESISVLGNVAAAGVGALAGWWSGRLSARKGQLAIERDDDSDDDY